MKQYIGDSVYIEDEGSMLILTTENGMPSDPSNQIYLEPEVYEALLQFVKTLPQSKGEDDNGNQE